MLRLKGSRFPRQIIAWAVWAYCRSAMSTADAEELLAERVITGDKRREYCTHHEAIVDAIARRNPDQASDAMHMHISVIVDDLFPKFSLPPAGRWL